MCIGICTAGMGRIFFQEGLGMWTESCSGAALQLWLLVVHWNAVPVCFLAKCSEGS